MTRALLVAGLWSLAPVLIAGLPRGGVPTPAGSRTVVVVSDLHMGEGRRSDGSWSPLEDFRWPAELAAFLDAVSADSKDTTELILNGDTFDLLQSTTAICAYADASLGCTEAETLLRLERALRAHAAELESLARFAKRGSNRIVLVPGDHDAGLLFRSVARRLLSVLATPPGRAEVALTGYWRSADGQIYAEHGHQVGYSAHRFEHWPAPFVSRAGRVHVARPWGERLMQKFYQRFEAKYPAVDNVAAFGAGVRFALAAEGTTDVGDEAPELLRYLLLTMPWQQFRMELDDGEVEPPTWNLGQVRTQGAAFLVSAVPDDDPIKPLMAKALGDGRLARSLDALTDAELVALCDYRAAVRRSRRRNEPVLTQLSGRGPVVTECPRTEDTRGARFEYFWRSRDLTFARELEAAARRSQNGMRPIAVFVHDHTHLADRSQTSANMISGGLLKIAMEGFAPVRGAAAPVVINGGAWQRTITPVQLERLKAERGVSYRELLATLDLEQLSPCYSFVHIGSYADTPVPVVRYWRMGDTGEWAIAAACGR